MNTLHWVSLSSCVLVAACSGSSGNSTNGNGAGGVGAGSVNGAGAVGLGGATTLPVDGAGGTSNTGGFGANGGNTNASGGDVNGTGGNTNAGGDVNGTGGATPLETGGTGAGGNGNPTACSAGNADPSKAGPFATTTEQNVGPSTSYTLFRPSDLSQGCQAHPVITWGNGTGTTPDVYGFLLTRLASHGFVVIASNSENVLQGTPPPMLDGVTWVLQENDDATSPLYHHIDAAHIGATGHSQGALATMVAGADARITTIAPIEGFVGGALHGPALLLCGGQDLHSPGIGCDAADSTFGSLTVPAMDAKLLIADHTNWITASIQASFGGTPMSGFVTAVVGWMRVQLMADANLRSMFYGPSCTLCTDTANWAVQQKNLN